MKDKIEKILEAANIEFKLIPLPEDLPMDIPSHMKFYRGSMQHALATMIYKTEKGFIAVQRRGDTKVSSKKLRESLNIKRLNLATEDEMKKLGLTPGLVPPLGLDIPLYTDKKILELDYIYDGTGHKLFGLKIGVKDLLKVNGATVGDFTIYEEQFAKKRVLSGIRATGRLHLGNYLGAVKGMLALQEDPNYETLYCVVDLHAITTPYDSKALAQNAKEVVLDYLACGIDPEKSAIYIQSDLADLITQLAFYFSTATSVARMQHLPTYKEKVKQHPQHVTMALLNYPVLMAADILIYKASLVPVGIDQEPHLEVTREIARKMNETYGTDFPEPRRFATKGEYIPSLTGAGKMSKSVEGSYISLTDDLLTIKKKLAGAPTDSGKGKEVPTLGGVANLLKFVELFEGEDARRKYEQGYREKGIVYSELKAKLAEAIYKELEPIQKRRAELEKQPDYVEKVLKEGAAKARKVAEETASEVREKMGIE